MGAVREAEKIASDPHMMLNEINNSGLSEDMRSLTIGSMAPALRTEEMTAYARGLGPARFGSAVTPEVSDAAQASAKGRDAELNKWLEAFGNRMATIIEHGNNQLLDGLATRVRVL